VKARALALPEVLLIEREAHADARGWLMEAWSARDAERLGLPTTFAQHNRVESRPGVVRGLHLQHPGAQAKVVEVLLGAILDVAVDVRVGSPTFGRHVAVRLDARTREALFVPAGFAHGYATLGEEPALVAYAMTAPRASEHELALRHDDPDLAIDWTLAVPLLSARDATAPRLRDVDPARLPRYAPRGERR
jgi:dTDP-4-dehydrorhamnose 3,5-epimerase